MFLEFFCLYIFSANENFWQNLSGYTLFMNPQTFWQRDSVYTYILQAKLSEINVILLFHYLFWPNFIIYHRHFVVIQNLYETDFLNGSFYVNIISSRKFVGRYRMHTFWQKHSNFYGQITNVKMSAKIHQFVCKIPHKLSANSDIFWEQCSCVPLFPPMDSSIMVRVGGKIQSITI